MKGIVQATKIDRELDQRLVQIDGKWYELADHVKMDYVKNGSVEYTQSNGVVTFIKSVKTEFTKQSTESKQFDQDKRAHLSPEQVNTNSLSLSIQLKALDPSVDIIKQADKFKEYING